MNILVDLFVTFLKIGTFAVGGGPSMIPLIERDAVYNKEWISKEEFVDMIALAQSIPGPIAVDASVFIGYRVAGIPGSILCGIRINILSICSNFTNSYVFCWYEQKYKCRGYF